MSVGSIQSSGNRYKPQVGAQMSSPNVIPMADIMLVLLIIFMVVTPMLQKNKPVDMARTNTARDMQDADKEDAVVGRIAVGDGPLHLRPRRQGLHEGILPRDPAAAPPIFERGCRIDWNPLVG